MIKFNKYGHPDNSDPRIKKIESVISENMKDLLEGLSPVEARAIGFAPCQGISTEVSIFIIRSGIEKAKAKNEV